MVPSIYWQGENRTEPMLFPVLGFWHDDVILDVHEWHLHFDIRFYTEEMEIYWGKQGNPGIGLVNGFKPGNPEFDRIRNSGFPLTPFVCVRQFPELKIRLDSVYPVYSALEDSLEKATCKKSCRTCPHKGTPLDGVEPKDGKITCPLHGLQWDAETGKLVRQTVTRKYKSNCVSWKKQ
jgi:hypothetical protein